MLHPMNYQNCTVLARVSHAYNPVHAPFLPKLDELCTLNAAEHGETSASKGQSQGYGTSTVPDTKPSFFDGEPFPDLR